MFSINCSVSKRMASWYVTMISKELNARAALDTRDLGYEIHAIVTIWLERPSFFFFFTSWIAIQPFLLTFDKYGCCSRASNHVYCGPKGSCKGMGCPWLFSYGSFD